MKISFIFLFLFFSTYSFSQDYYNTDSIAKKTKWSVGFNFPTTRSFIYSIGIEREQRINKNLSFTSAIGFGAYSANNNRPQYRIVPLSVFIQPFHLLAGAKKLKFETGVTFSYLNYDVTNNPNDIPKKAEETSYTNLFIGGRYVSERKRFSIHAGWLPRWVLNSNYINTGKFFYQGLDVGATYVFSKK